MTQRKKLIEVAPPLEVINKTGVRKIYPLRYVWRTFTREPEFPIASVNVDLREMLSMEQELP